MKRARESKLDDEDESPNKRWKPSTCFPTELDQIILDYAVDDPLIEFMDASIIGNLKMAEWIFDQFKLDKVDKKLATEVYENKMPMAQDKALFYWSAKKLEITPNYQNMINKAIHNPTSMSWEIISIAFDNTFNPIVKYTELFKDVIYSKNELLFYRMLVMIPIPAIDVICENEMNNDQKPFLSAKIFKYLFDHHIRAFGPIASYNVCNTIKFMNENNDRQTYEMIVLFESEMKRFEKCWNAAESYVIFFCELRPVISPITMKYIIVNISNREKLLKNIQDKGKIITDYLKLIPDKDAKELSDLIIGGW